MSTKLSQVHSFAPTQFADAFGGELVGRLLSLSEIDAVSGAYGQCGPGPSSYTQTGGSYTQSGGSYTQSGGNYGMTC
jgi:hypothetical protein